MRQGGTKPCRPRSLSQQVPKRNGNTPDKVSTSTTTDHRGRQVILSASVLPAPPPKIIAILSPNLSPLS